MFAAPSARRAWAIMSFTLIVPASAHAQFGGFIKRAIGEKVAEKVSEKVTEKVTQKVERPRSDSAAGTIVSNAPVQLTADTLERALRGLDVLADASARRDSLGARGDVVSRRINELSSVNASVVRTYAEKANLIRACLEDTYSSVFELRAKALQARAAANPALRRRYAETWLKYAVAAQEASARADTGAIRRVMSSFYRDAFGPSFSSRQDTVSAQRKCGVEPPKPSVLALEDSLRRESQRLADARRDLETAAHTSAVAQSGLSAEKFDAARAKLELWYQARKSGHAAAFTPQEEEHLTVQLPRIERLMRALGVQG